ncbi:interleukin-17 receptor E-like protein [Xenentodon cancila]
MILWVVLLMYNCCLDGAAAESTALKRIGHCQTSCSQGLSCKTKPDYWFAPECQDPDNALNRTSVFHNISIFTVMKCEGKQKCELNLRVQAVLQLAEPIFGLSICTTSPGRIKSCKRIMFTRTSRTKMLGQQVVVENDCTEVYPNQQVQVTMTTVPSYCGITWIDTYHTPGCIHEDLRRNIPECITGRLSYDVNADKKELKIGVSDMLEDQDYHLRLCHKDFICVGTGAYTMIKKGQPIKSAVLHFSRPLPCLCIEGWSAMMDAPRVQVCPFKDRLEELWFGITFDPLEQSLLWEPACPVVAVVGLCEKREDGDCADLPHSLQNVSREKVLQKQLPP